jgi:hypothetical protein
LILPLPKDGYRRSAVDRRYLSLLARARLRSPLLGYLLPGRLSVVALIGAQFALCALVVLVLSVAVRELPVSRAFRVYVSIGVLTAMASGLRRGQVFYRQERQRALDLAALSGGDAERLYEQVTTGSPRLFAIGVAALSPLVQLGYHLITGEAWSTTLTACALCEFTAALYYVRAVVGHVAALLERIEPPQFLYLAAGITVGVVFRSAYQGGRPGETGTLVSALAGGAAAVALLSCALVLGIGAAGATAAAVRHLIRRGPLGRPSMRRRLRRHLLRFMPAVLWSQPGRPSGSVVFAFSLFATTAAFFVGNLRGSLQGFKPPYGAPEVLVAVQFGIGIVVATLWCAPLDLQRLGALGQLMRMALVRIDRERSKFLLAGCVPTLAVCAVIDWLTSWPTAGHLAGGVRALVWASGWLCTSVAALSVLLGPALGRPMDSGRAADDEMPAGEVLKVAVPCLMVAVLAAGYASTPTATVPRVAAFAALATAVGTAVLLRLALLARKVK